MYGVSRFCLPSAGVLGLFALALGAAPVQAVDYPLSGTVSVNGTLLALPSGGSFDGSSYDSASGAIGAGTFRFPQVVTEFDSPLGPVTGTFEITQTNTSGGSVDTDGVAALSVAHMRLEVVSALLYGTVPLPVYPCVFEPVDLYLAGIGAASGLSLADPAFTIPAVASSDCGGYGDAINAAVAGSDNAIDLQLSGDFTPPEPPDDDTIFRSGFDPGN